MVATKSYCGAGVVEIVIIIIIIVKSDSHFCSQVLSSDSQANLGSPVPQLWLLEKDALPL